VPAVTSVLINLVRNGDLVQVGKDVLHLGISVGALVASQVVEPGPLVEEIVDNRADDNDTDGVSPDDDGSDDAGVAVVGEELVVIKRISWLSCSTSQPAEDTEEGCENIDTEDGADELPGWPCVSTTSDEDEPIFSQGNFKEENALDSTEVVNDTSVGKEHGTADDPGAESEHYTQNNGDDPDLGQLPLDGALFEVSIIVSYGNGGQISEQGKEDNKIGSDGLADDNHGGDQVDFQVETQSDTVLDISLHTLENLAGDLDG